MRPYAASCLMLRGPQPKLSRHCLCGLASGETSRKPACGRCSRQLAIRHYLHASRGPLSLLRCHGTAGVLPGWQAGALAPTSVWRLARRNASGRTPPARGCFPGNGTGAAQSAASCARPVPNSKTGACLHSSLALRDPAASQQTAGALQRTATHAGGTTAAPAPAPPERRRQKALASPPTSLLPLVLPCPCRQPLARRCASLVHSQGRNHGTRVRLCVWRGARAPAGRQRWRCQLGECGGDGTSGEAAVRGWWQELALEATSKDRLNRSTAAAIAAGTSEAHCQAQGCSARGGAATRCAASLLHPPPSDASASAVLFVALKGTRGVQVCGCQGAHGRAAVLAAGRQP